MSNDLMLQGWQAMQMFIFAANYKSVRRQKKNNIKGLKSGGSFLTLLVLSVHLNY